MVAGAAELRLQLAELAVVVEPSEARWMLYAWFWFALGAVNVMRTSSATDPLSKLPTAALTLLGAWKPTLWQMLKFENPLGFGS